MMVSGNLTLALSAFCWKKGDWNILPLNIKLSGVSDQVRTGMLPSGGRGSSQKRQSNIASLMNSFYLATNN